jgi:hypothetical protein
MLSLVLSTVAFFLARYYVNRYLDDIGVPKSLTRGLVAFCAALLVAYGVALTVGWLAW